MLKWVRSKLRIIRRAKKLQKHFITITFKRFQELKNSFEIYPSEVVERDPPINLENKDIHLFSREFKRSFDRVKSEEYRNVSIYSNGAIQHRMRILQNLYFCKSIPLKGAIKVKSLIMLYLNTVKLLFKSSKVTRIDNALFLTNFYSDNFFHWFGDVLQKLEAIEDKGIDLKEYVLIIPATCDNSYTRYTLDKYKISYHIMDKEEIIKTKSLVYVPLISPTGNFRPDLMDRMKNRFFIKMVSEKKKRVYISRRNAPKRKLVNENEILPILEAYNFSMVIMENLSIEEQIKYISESDTLLSLHGAGLTHMLWMKEGGKVIEIRAEGDSKNNVFYNLASAINLDYFYVFANNTNKSLSTQKTDFIVNPSALEEFLSKKMEL